VTEIGGGTTEEEVPLVHVDGVLSAEDAGGVQERIEELVFFEEATTDVDVEGFSDV